MALRRFCSPGVSHADVALEEGRPAPKILLESERLERVMKSAKDPAREPLLWQNAFFGRRIRRRVKRPKWGFTAKNAPLFVIPDALSEFVKYAYVSPDAARAYAALAHERVVEQKAAKRAKRGCE